MYNMYQNQNLREEASLANLPHQPDRPVRELVVVLERSWILYRAVRERGLECKCSLIVRIHSGEERGLV